MVPAPETQGALLRYRTSAGAASYAGKHARSWTRRQTARREARILRRFLAAFDLGASLLNVPCGAGRFADVIDPGRRRRVVFADASQPMLEAARAALAAMGAGAVELRIEDVTQPAAPEKFDLVLCLRLLHHLDWPEDLSAALDHLGAAATRGIICTFASSSTWKGWWRRRRRSRAGRPGEALRSRAFMDAAFRARGWRVADARRVSPLFSTQVWLLLVPIA